jgi:hypothetical protein
MAPGSAEEFIFEHYWGYTALRDGGTAEYQVEHPAWRVWTAENPRLECAASVLYGSGFAEALGARPHSAFVAEGSPITVRGGARLRESTL